MVTYTDAQIDAMGPCERLTALHLMIEDEKQRVRSTRTGTMDKASDLILEMNDHFNTSFSLQDAIYQRARLTVLLRYKDDSDG